MESFGTYLRNEREARKISLEEISRATKIRRTILEAMENDRAEVLPPEVFLKGFLEAYARYVGLNPEEVLVRYNEWKRKDTTDEPFFDNKKVMPRRYIFAGGIVAMAIILAFLLLSAGGPQEEAGKTTVSTDHSTNKRIATVDRVQPSLLIPSIDESTPPPHEGLQEEEKKPLPSQEHTLVIEASERTWIEVREGTSPPFDVILYSGERYTRTSPYPFELLIGNAGGVTVTFDGRGVGFLGEAGQVVKITLPPGGGG